MSKDTEARFGVLECRVKAIEAYLKLMEGYDVIKGQNMADQIKRSEEQRLQRTQERLEKEKLPPKILISRITNRLTPDANGLLIMNFTDMHETSSMSRSGFVGQEAAEQLQQRKLTGLHLVYMRKDRTEAILATANDVQQLPTLLDSLIHSDTPVEVELNEDAFKTQDTF